MYFRKQMVKCSNGHLNKRHFNAIREAAGIPKSIVLITV